MSAYAGPEVVSNGLVLSLDAGNARSYPGSGTTWTDLAAARAGTLTNGPTFSSSTGGSIVFDGVNDFIEFGDVLDLGTNDMTINVWVRFSSISADCAIVSKGAATTQNYRWHGGLIGGKITAFMMGTGVTEIQPSGSSTINTNTWYMFTYVYTRSSSITLYVNSVLETLTGSSTISQWNGLDFQSINPLRVGTFTAGDNVGITGVFPGNISNVQIYFRSLSAAEIRQNFNAFRGRYGI